MAEETLLSRLRTHATETPDRTFGWFVGDREIQVTWRDLFARSARVAESLRGCGVRSRETVFVLAPLGPDLLAAFLGAMLQRAVPSLLSYPSSKVAPEVYADNLRGVLEITGSRTVITTRALAEPLERALAGVGGVRLLWLEDMEAPLLGADAHLETIAAVPAAEIAFLQHSSGSTGLQKGVALSHRAVLNQVRHYAKAIALEPSRDKIASWLPLYHDMGLIATFLMPLITATPVVYMDPFRWVVDPAILLEVISRHRATLTWLPNFAYVHLARRVDPGRLAGLDLSSMRGFVNCSEPVREASHRLFLERFGPSGVREDMLWTCYAMAENTFAVTQGGGPSPRVTDWVDRALLASERRAHPVPSGAGAPVVSCGPPIEGCEIRIVDEARRPVAERAVGEVALRSDCMLTEYHGNVQATAAALDGGFYFTGDLGYIASNHLYITGRKKDLIIVGGKNFHPQDLEDLASEQEGVIPGRVVAFGVSAEESGTEQVVVVVETVLENEDDRGRLRRTISRVVLERLDCSVERVLLVERGWLIKTSSGKIARTANVEKCAASFGDSRRESRVAAPVPEAPRESIPALVLKVMAAAFVIALAIVLRPNRVVVLYQGF